MKKNLKRKTTSKLNDEPIGELHRATDFLPPPELLLQHEEVTKITLSIDTQTIAFFKTFAEKNGTKYQRMMREVLKGYARRYGT